MIVILFHGINTIKINNTGIIINNTNFYIDQ